MPVFRGMMSFSFGVMGWLLVVLYVSGAWVNVDNYFCG